MCVTLQGVPESSRLSALHAPSLPSTLIASLSQLRSPPRHPSPTHTTPTHPPHLHSHVLMLHQVAVPLAAASRVAPAANRPQQPGCGLAAAKQAAIRHGALRARRQLQQLDGNVHTLPGRPAAAAALQMCFEWCMDVVSKCGLSCPKQSPAPIDWQRIRLPCKGSRCTALQG